MSENRGKEQNVGAEVRENLLPDFSDWKAYTAYKGAYDKLLWNLCSEDVLA